MTRPLFPDLVVNGEVVPHAVVAAEVQNHTAPKGKPGLAWRKAADAVAIRTLLLQQARAERVTATPLELAPGRFETQEEALIRALLDTHIAPAQPSAAQVRAEWARDPSRFRSPPLWEVSHILVACDPRDTPTREAARQRADELTARAQANPRGFARLAQEHSDCASRNSGGALGQLGPSDTVPEFETALRHLAEGQITPTPVLTRHGWHVIRMDALAPGAVLPFKTVAPRIRAALEKTAWARAARAYTRQLVATASIQGADLTTH